MSFHTPAALLLLLLIPLLLYAHDLRRRRAVRYAVRFPAAATLLAAGAAVPAWRRYLPLGLLLASIAALAVAVARPQRTVRVALQQASIVLVTDHSGSMQATDVDPTRLAAAQKAARTFVDKLPGDVRVGEVGFSESPDIIQPPTTDHGAVKRAIDSQIADGPTATGDALLLALGLVRPGTKRPPAAIILLSDGATTVGRDPIAVAEEAKRVRVPVYTVALGSADATVPNPDPFGPPLSAAPDPGTLREVARITGARAFTAQDEGRLSSIYDRLGSQLGSKHERREETAAFAVAGLVLLAGAAFFSLARAGRLP